jgi:hypothetical protein
MVAPTVEVAREEAAAAVEEGSIVYGDGRRTEAMDDGQGNSSSFPAFSGR